jgi:hypothetical protein
MKVVGLLHVRPAYEQAAESGGRVARVMLRVRKRASDELWRRLARAVTV